MGQEIALLNSDDTFSAQQGTNGAAHVTTAGSPGALETRTIRIDAATDMPADITSNANVLADLIKLNTFTSGKKRARVTFHYNGPNDGTDGPICVGAFVTLNAGSGLGDDVIAADRLTYTDLTGAGTGSSDSKKRMVSATNNIIEWSLDTATVENIYIAGIPVPTAAAPTNIIPIFIEVEVW